MQNYRTTQDALCCLAIIGAQTATVIAQGTAFTYQGRLHSGGTPYTGAAEFQPTLWDADSGGAQMAANSPATVIVSINDGLFSLPLDFGAGAFATGAGRWLQLEVRTTIGPFTPLSPRQSITAAPYAFSAGTFTGPLGSSLLSGTYSSGVTFGNAANSFSGSGTGLVSLNASQLTSGTVPDVRLSSNVAMCSAGNQFTGSQTVTGGNVGIGTTTPQEALHVVGVVRVDGSGPNAMVITNGQGTAIFCRSSGDAQSAILASRSDSGSYLETLGGAGVCGYSAMTNHGIGVVGFTDPPQDDLTARGVAGLYWPNNSFGTLGSSEHGVYGEQNGGTAAGAGVYGFSTSENGNGLYGEASVGDYSCGVYGATTNANAYAGFFQGRVQVLSDLEVAGVKQFKIDHPQDPGDQYLLHACVESSEMMNLYSGKVVLDEHGRATVRLPDYFESLNKDIRYQLTAIGAPAPNLHVARKVQANTFGIRGGTPGLEVSWKVSGIRSDAWDKAHPMVVEARKAKSERGRYLHPELYGQTAAKSIQHAHKGQPVSRLPLRKAVIRMPEGTTAEREVK